jgi:malate synthase
MEDAATAEICRTQIWQWLKHKAHLADGRLIDEELLRTVIEEEMLRLQGELGHDRIARGHFEEAVALFLDVATPPAFCEFLTLPAYRRITAGEPS